MEKYIVRAVKNPKYDLKISTDENGFAYYNGGGGSMWNCWTDRIDKAKQFLKAEDAGARAWRANNETHVFTVPVINAEVIKVEVEIKVIEVIKD